MIVLMIIIVTRDSGVDSNFVIGSESLTAK